MGLNFVENSTAHDSMEPLESFDFDSFLRDAEEGTTSSTALAPELDPILVTDGPITPLHATCYFTSGTQPPSPPVPDAKLVAVRDEANKAAESYIQTIVEIHKASKGVIGLSYPEDIQNLLLTTSRTIKTIATHLDDESKSLTPGTLAEPLDTLEQDIINCNVSCQQIRASCPKRLEAVDDVVLVDKNKEAWEDFRHMHESRICKLVQPLLVYYKHLKCGDDCDTLDHIMEYEAFPRHSDDGETEIGETRSISSEATLLGVQEEKGKLKEYEGHIIEGETEEIEPKGCLSGLFSGFGKPKPKAQSSEKVVPKSSGFAKLMAKLTPSRFRTMHHNSHLAKVVALSESICNAAADGSLYTNPTLLNNKALTTEVMTQTNILAFAAALGDITFVKFLLARDAPVDGVGPYMGFWSVPLGRAIFGGKTEVCEILLKAGAKMDGKLIPYAYDRPEQESTYDSCFLEVGYGEALITAVILRKVDIIRVLLKHGAIDHSKLEEGLENAFHIAATRGTEVLKPFLEHDGLARYINHPGKKLCTALHSAVEASNLEAVKLLVSAGANLEARNIRLSTPLHWAIKHKQSEIATYLIDHGADIESPRVRLETPLKYAICNGRQTIISKLLAKGANANASTCEAKYPLHSAAAHESHKIVSSLLDAGANINCRTKYGSTPLYLACQNGRVASAKILLEHGADMRMGRTGFGSRSEKGPKSIARKNGNWEVVRLLECWEQGREYVLNKEIEDDADDHSCSWENWFERYIVRVYERDSSA